MLTWVHSGMQLGSPSEGAHVQHRNQDPPWTPRIIEKVIQSSETGVKLHVLGKIP